MEKNETNHKKRTILEHKDNPGRSQTWKSKISRKRNEDGHGQNDQTDIGDNEAVRQELSGLLNSVRTVPRWGSW